MAGCVFQTLNDSFGSSLLFSRHFKETSTHCDRSDIWENNMKPTEQHRLPVNSWKTTYTLPSPHRALWSEAPDPRSDCWSAALWTSLQMRCRSPKTHKTHRTLWKKWTTSQSSCVHTVCNMISKLAEVHSITLELTTGKLSQWGDARWACRLRADFTKVISCHQWVWL